MSMADEMKRLAEDIITSYENRISTVGMIIDGAHRTLEDFSVRRREMSAQLKERLAREKTLRKKDFDRMMADIVSSQEEREGRIRASLKAYLDEQKEAAGAVRECLSGNGASGFGDGQGVIDGCRAVLDGLQERRQRREAEVHGMLEDFRAEQHRMAESLRGLLRDGRQLRVQELKSMLRNFRAQRERNREDLRDGAASWLALELTMTGKRAERGATGTTNTEACPGFRCDDSRATQF